MINEIYHLKSVGSTNRYVKNSSVFREGDVILADVQTGGRGMGANSWESAMGENITGSIVLTPTFLIPAECFLVSMAVSVGIMRFLSQFTQCAKIKWPNDIYVDDKKLAGILIENEFTSASVTRSIVGVGMNVYQRSFQLAPNPVSLCQITDLTLDLSVIEKELFGSVFSAYRELAKFSDFIVKQYHDCLLGVGQVLPFRDQQGVFNGIIKRVDHDGGISIVDENGRVRRYYFKEIEFLLTNQ